MTTTNAPTKEEVQRIVVDDLPTVAFTMRLVGQTPLITNRFGESAIEKLEGGQTGKGKAPKVAREPEAEFEEGIYRLPDGSCGIPASAVRKAIASAAMRMTGGEQKGTVVLASFTIQTGDGRGYLAIEGPAPRMRRDHVVRMGKGNLAYRPEFWPWAINVPVTLYLPNLSVPEFIQLVRMAGFGIGLGNWRPEKKGDFGTFDVEIRP